MTRKKTNNDRLSNALSEFETKLPQSSNPTTLAVQCLRSTYGEDLQIITKPRLSDSALYQSVSIVLNGRTSNRTLVEVELLTNLFTDKDNSTTIESNINSNLNALSEALYLLGFSIDIQSVEENATQPKEKKFEHKISETDNVTVDENHNISNGLLQTTPIISDSSSENSINQNDNKDTQSNLIDEFTKKPTLKKNLISDDSLQKIVVHMKELNISQGAVLSRLRKDRPDLLSELTKPQGYALITWLNQCAPDDDAIIRKRSKYGSYDSTPSSTKEKASKSKKYFLNFSDLHNDMSTVVRKILSNYKIQVKDDEQIITVLDSLPEAIDNEVTKEMASYIISANN